MNDLKSLDDTLNADAVYRISETKDIVYKVFLENLDLIEAGAPPNLLTIPYLISEPGIGKSSIFAQIAKMLNAHFEVVILNQFDVAELGGFPWLDRSSDEPTYRRARPFFLPRESSKERPVLIFWDEATQAFLANQNILGQAVLEGRIGEHVFPKYTLQAVASNDMTHRAGTTKMPAQVESRLTHYKVKPHYEDTIEYFYNSGVHEKIIACLRIAPDILNVFDPATPNCPSPRTWEQCSPIVASTRLTPREKVITMMGKIGKAAANKYAYIEKVYTQIPNPDDVIAHPDTADIPDPDNRSDWLYVLLTAIAARTTEQNAKNIIIYARRIVEVTSQEYANYLVASMLDRTGGRTQSPLARRNKEVKAYIREFASNLYWTNFEDSEISDVQAILDQSNEVDKIAS